jgi:hypothetical protein
MRLSEKEQSTPESINRHLPDARQNGLMNARVHQDDLRKVLHRYLSVQPPEWDCTESPNETP